MSILAWIIVGLIAGLIARALVPGEEPGGLLADLLVGILGAIVGGWIFSALGLAGSTGLNLWSIIVATLGAALLLIIYHAFVGRRTVA